jgi:hypothetical protein
MNVVAVVSQDCAEDVDLCKADLAMRLRRDPCDHLVLSIPMLTVLTNAICSRPRIRARG